jgi:hypothetical protein
MTQRVLEQIRLFGYVGDLSIDHHLAQSDDSVPHGDHGSRICARLLIQPSQLVADLGFIRLFKGISRLLEGVERRAVAIIADGDQSSRDGSRGRIPLRGAIFASTTRFRESAFVRVGTEGQPCLVDHDLYFLIVLELLSASACSATQILTSAGMKVPTYSKLRKLCNARFWNLLPGC